MPDDALSQSLEGRETLIERSQGLVRSIALGIYRRLPPGFDADDLIGYGQVGLLEAVEDFRQDGGASFPTYAWYRIRGAVLDGVLRMSWGGRRGRAGVRYAVAADDILSQETVSGSGVAPQVDFGSSVRTLGTAFLLSLNSDRESEPETPAETPEELLMKSEWRSRVAVAVDLLSDSERKLVTGVYFEGLSISDAGKRQNMSRAWSSRLHARALQHLSRILGDSGLEC